jgi:hypothetical protein
VSTSDIDAMAAEADRPFRHREFAGHAFAFVVVNAFLFALWGPGTDAGLWPVWVAAGWAVLLALDAWRAFAPSDAEPVTQRRRKAPAVTGQPA